MKVPLSQLVSRLQELDRRYAQLEGQVAAQAGSAQQNPSAYQQLARELSDLRKIVQTFRTYQRIAHEGDEADVMANAQGDAELRELAGEEATQLRQQQQELLGHLERLWSARHEEPERPVIVEIRAGTGGLEASLFAGDLYRLYSKYAQKVGLTIELMHTSLSEAGGFKELAFAVKGPGAWKRFKYESGVHRVQRVPQTEAQGRIHTSTVTVAVMPEPEEIELPPIPTAELQIDVYRSSGPGGQGVNTTDSAVRIRHVPTGLIVTCQDERSQLRNKEKAMRVLRARLLDQTLQAQQQARASDRRRQVGTGERSEKIRTYNFPDRRITDHRVGLTVHKFDAVMEGDLEAFHEALLAKEHEDKAAAEGDR